MWIRGGFRRQSRESAETGMRGKRIFVVAVAFALLACWVLATIWVTNAQHQQPERLPEIPVAMDARLPAEAAPAAESKLEPAPKISIAPNIPESRPLPALESNRSPPLPHIEQVPVATASPSPVEEVEPVDASSVSASVAQAEPVPIKIRVDLSNPANPVNPTETAQPLPEPAVIEPRVKSAQALRELPARIALRFSVQSGEDGIVIGQSYFNGQFENGRYVLTSVTEATGVAALFVSGKIIQTSEGEITAQGLQPHSFRSVKGKRSPLVVRFDRARSRLTLPGGEVDLPRRAQDLTSFPFHLAMMMSDEVAEMKLPVTNGKKLRDYTFKRLGRHQLRLGDSAVETLHLRSERDSDGSIDVWLAPARNWLPVRIRTLDEKGKLILLTLRD